jgi:hypothetical protein
MADEKISDMANNHPLTVLDGTEFVPVIKLGDAENYAVAVANFTSGFRRKGIDVAVSAGLNVKIAFDTDFVASYSLSIFVHDNTGITLRSKAHDAFYIDTPIDIVLDYTAEA